MEPQGNVPEARVFAGMLQGSALPKLVFLCEDVGFPLGFS